LPLIIITSCICCEFIPTETKVGEIGGHERKLFVCQSQWECYDLGESNNESAKLSYATSMAALASNKKVRLRYYNQENCNHVMAHHIPPSSVWLRR